MCNQSIPDYRIEDTLSEHITQHIIISIMHIKNRIQIDVKRAQGNGLSAGFN
jgi:hypothetical protein